VLNIFRYKYFGDWYFIGDTNLAYDTYAYAVRPRFYLVTKGSLWYLNSDGKPSIMLDKSLFGKVGYVANSIDEILERLPQEAQNEILFNLHRFTGSKSA